MTSLIQLPRYSACGTWIYTGRVYGWLPVPGTTPKRPRRDRPIPFAPTLAPVRRAE